MIYVVLQNIDEIERPDSGTSWGIYEAESPEEAGAKAGVGQGDFYIVRVAGSWGPTKAVAISPCAVQDFESGYAEDWRRRI